MLLISIVIILFYIGMYLYIQYAFPNPIQNQRAQREFKLLLRQVYSAKTKEELKEYETWFLEFILAYELTKEEKTWYNDTFFNIYARKLVKVKEDI